MIILQAISFYCLWSAPIIVFSSNLIITKLPDQCTRVELRQPFGLFIYSRIEPFKINPCCRDLKPESKSILELSGHTMDDDIFRRRYTIRKWMRRNRTNGCLEYIGPLRGRIAGNPLISISSGRATTHLRRWVWEITHGPLPKGKYVRMTCNNNRCHEPSHMSIVKEHPHGDSYGPKKTEFIVRLSAEQIRSIRYYKGIVSGSLIAQIVGMKKTSVWTLWISVCNAQIITPKGWHPSKAFDRRVEDESISFADIYLGPQTLRNAKKDIDQSHLSAPHKILLTRMIEGEKAFTLTKELKLSYNGVLYIFRRSLLTVHREVGNRRWIFLASKGRIHHWKQTTYRYSQ
jgi:hypothetical protein